ncbi:MAG: right-handed parallel beta-helix repeat-containing protein [Bacteroidales bacterium]|nr:right-handed parallel beta-helix repeat-containing protein [Bacteroidales bacterium]
MKVFSWLLGILCTMTGIQATAQSCSISIPTTQNTIDGSQFLPGDTICLEPGLRSYLLITNCTGTASQPIVFINKTGIVRIDTDHYYGIKLARSSHVKIIGNIGHSSEYGIVIQRVGNGAGISLDELSTDIELAYLEISNTAIGGIYAKTDPDCSFTATRDSFTMYNLHIHHCYLHDIADEGMYIGSTKYTGQYLPDCDTTVFPHYIYGVEVHDNIIERTGWDGIQVSSSPLDCRIYNNIIREDSYAEVPDQMSGILIGGGSVCDCYNNIIADGKGDGIDIFGHQKMKIYNNLILRSGRTFQPGNETAYKHGIFVGNSPGGESSTLHIMHNTIISPKSEGIKFFNTNSSGNLIFNNIVTNPGSYQTIGKQAYFNPALPDSYFSVRNNMFSEYPQSIKFVDYQSDDFDLQASSTAVNTGFDAGLNAVSFDLLDRPRPHNQGYDIGAFECQDPHAMIQLPDATASNITVEPNPVTDKLYVTIANKVEHIIQYQIITVHGYPISRPSSLNVPAHQKERLQIDVSELTAGIYFLRIFSQAKVTNLVFVKSN